MKHKNIIPLADGGSKKKDPIYPELGNGGGHSFYNNQSPLGCGGGGCSNERVHHKVRFAEDAMWIEGDETIQINPDIYDINN